MGEEIRQEHFVDRDFARFAARLRQETALLEDWFRRSPDGAAPEKTGFELEFCLLDQAQAPAPENQAVLHDLQDLHLVPELSRFNLEINSDPHRIGPAVLSELRRELEALWGKAAAAAGRRGLKPLMIGILPTLSESQLNMRNMSPLHRYHVLNEQVLRQRRGRPLRLDIHGRERLVAEHADVMLEAAATSLQVHLQVPPGRAARFFNAALLASAPLVALAANSPFLFGKDLWAETRIPLFEQAVDLNSPVTGAPPLGRVTFGSGYVRHSLFECFSENLERYPILLPEALAEAPERLPHLRLHNGTIWRWNRPIVAPDEAGCPQLRIEHRVMAAGPSIPDVVANIAAFLGLAHALAALPEAPEERLSFETARENFYAAAEGGLDAEISWFGGQRRTLRELWLGDLLTRVREGLHDLNLAPGDISYYLEEVLYGRVKTGRTGAAWQREFAARHGRDFPALVAAYAERQEGGLPVHAWNL
ncbi:MAG: glutamate-cysteine ligase family protein [bacterium]